MDAANDAIVKTYIQSIAFSPAYKGVVLPRFVRYRSFVGPFQTDIILYICTNENNKKVLF